MKNQFTNICSAVLLLTFLSTPLISQPVPGEVYREYSWFNDVDDCDRSLRVGGKLDYRLTGKALPVDSDGRIVPDFDVKLEHALKAELVVEKMLCHGGTEGLRVSINGNAPLTVPESSQIPSPQSAYAHHFNSVVPVDLSLLKEGTGNRFEFDVDTAGHWWPQNLVYGMVLRIYYEPFVVAKRSKIKLPDPGDKIGLKAKVEFDHPEQKQVERIDLVGYYEDADMEGDGLYGKWHYAYHKGKIYRNIATLELMKKRGTWDTEWLPDQEDPMKLAAFVHMESGYSYMTEAVEGLILERPDYSVELCKPYEIPEGWFTRNGEFSERFQVKGDPTGATEARLVFRSWSPGYFNGIYVNDFIVFVKDGPEYAYYEHNITLDLHVLEKGENILKTGKTPKYHGEEVHGVEIQWPGIMVLIKYDPKEQTQKFGF